MRSEHSCQGPVQDCGAAWRASRTRGSFNQRSASLAGVAGAAGGKVQTRAVSAREDARMAGAGVVCRVRARQPCHVQSAHVQSGACFAAVFRGPGRQDPQRAASQHSHNHKTGSRRADKARHTHVASVQGGLCPSSVAKLCTRCPCFTAPVTGQVRCVRSTDARRSRLLLLLLLMSLDESMWQSSNILYRLRSVSSSETCSRRDAHLVL